MTPPALRIGAPTSAHETERAERIGLAPHPTEPYPMIMNNATLTLKDRVSGNRMYLTIRDGVVVGAMGADPARYMGLTESAARRKARYGQK